MIRRAGWTVLVFVSLVSVPAAQVRDPEVAKTVRRALRGLLDGEYRFTCVTPKRPTRIADLDKYGDRVDGVFTKDVRLWKWRRPKSDPATVARRGRTWLRRIDGVWRRLAFPPEADRMPDPRVAATNLLDLAADEWKNLDLRRDRGRLYAAYRAEVAVSETQALLRVGVATRARLLLLQRNSTSVTIDLLIDPRNGRVSRLLVTTNPDRTSTDKEPSAELMMTFADLADGALPLGPLVRKPEPGPPAPAGRRSTIDKRAHELLTTLSAQSRYRFRGELNDPFATGWIPVSGAAEGATEQWKIGSSELVRSRGRWLTATPRGEWLVGDTPRGITYVPDMRFFARTILDVSARSRWVLQAERPERIYRAQLTQKAAQVLRELGAFSALGAWAWLDAHGRVTHNSHTSTWFGDSRRLEVLLYEDPLTRLARRIVLAVRCPHLERTLALLAGARKPTRKTKLGHWIVLDVELSGFGTAKVDVPREARKLLGR